jgi:hypothetical protein
MESTAYEINKLQANVYTVNYEDFVKDPKGCIAKMMEYTQLKPSGFVDTFMEKISVQNRNNRAAVSSKTALSEETKKKIMQMVGG